MNKKISTTIGIVVIIILAVIVVGGVYIYQYYRPVIENENNDIEEMEEQWIKEALIINPVEDPRLDNDKLRPVINYDGEIISINKSYNNNTGEGWQITGAVIDIVVDNSSKYILFGKSNERYRGGYWNNTLDNELSFKEYVVIKREGNSSKVIIQERLIPTTSQILLGLRYSKDNKGFEVIQNSTGYPQVINTYQFEN